MRRRAFLKSAAAGAAGAVLMPIGARAAGARRDTSKMNVLFIDIEDMTAESVGCYGNPVVKTPVMDAFAKTGVRFGRCYCQAPMCNPSRTSFLTGLRPDSTQVYSNGDPMSACLPADATSLGELLNKRGIYSINIGKLYHHTWTAEKQLSAFDRLEFCERPKGYEGKTTGLPDNLKKRIAALPKPKFRYSADPEEEKQFRQLKVERDKIWKTAKPGSPEYNKARAMFQQPQANVVGDSGLLEEQEGDGKKARLACHILKELAQEKRQFFICLGFSKPHTPLRCPKKYLDLYDFADIPAPPAPPENDRGIPDVAKRFGFNYDIFNRDYEHHPVSTEAARRAIHAYYACASFIDAQIGLVLDTLEREGLADNTIVIMFSDHGFQLGEHNLWSKYTLFEQSTRVPMLMRVPGVSARGADCDEIVEMVDFLPTLCELLDLDAPDNFEGTSFVPLLKQPKQPWKKAAFTILPMQRFLGRSARTKRWRYAEWRLQNGKQVELELYDLESDPWETTNLAADPKYAEQVKKHAATLKAGWRAARP